jgi:hypothetical protein
MIIERGSQLLGREDPNVAEAVFPSIRAKAPSC